MVHVIIITNPFDAAKGKKEYWEPYVENKPVREYHSQCGARLYAVNGVQVDENATVQDGQEVVIAPKIERKAFGWILAIGLTIFSAGMAGAAFGAGVSGWLMAGRIAGALAMSLIGNRIMMKLTMPKADLSNASEQSNTYGWGTPSTLTGQGYVLPICYGKVKTAGMMLQRHVISDGKNQYLNILYCLAEGVIDDVTDIKLNSNPIENYTDVSINIRNGSNQQSIIPDFNDSYADTALAYELNVGKWSTVTLEGDAANGIEITLAFPNGLYYSNDSGAADYTSVTIKAQYRKVGASDWEDILIRNENYQWEPDWITGSRKFIGVFTKKQHYYNDCRKLVGYETYTDWRGKTRYRYDEDGKKIPIYTYSMTYDEWWKKIHDAHLYDGIIRQKETGVFYRMYRVYDLDPAQYEVRVQCTAKDRTDIRTANKVQWVAVTQVIYDDFSHPGKALLGLKALATDQLSGSDPQLTCVIERSTVYVWNPSKEAYEMQAASNPAWACYDILHGCRKLLNSDKQTYSYEAEGISKENMDYYAFAAWAAMCDSANIQFNYLFDSAMKMWDAVNYPCRVGRGSVIIVGTKVSCIYDYASPAVQLFTVANIKKDSFSNEYLATESRANSIEISFMNREKNYERDVLAVFNEEYDSSDAVAQPTQIELMGCTDAKQAYQYGKYKLRENKYEIRTIQFEAFADSIACQIGDVITVQTDVTEWGIGGRVVSVDGNTVTVDVDNLDGGNYTSFMYRDNTNDSLVKKNVVSAVGNTVIIDGISTVEKDDVYALGKAGYQAKEFKVLSISTNMDEETRTITAVEYYPELYDSDTDKVPEIIRPVMTIEAPKNLILSTEKYTEFDGNITSLVHCTWINPRQFNTVCLEKSNDGVNWTFEKKFTQNESSYTFTALSLQIYRVRVYAINDIGEKSDYTENNILTDGQDMLPPDVESINVEKMASGLRRYWWKFTYPYPNDIAGFRIKYTQGQELNWDNGIPVQAGLITTQPYETQTIRQGTHSVMIKAVDRGGNESKNFAYCQLEMGDLLQENVLFEKDFGANNFAELQHNGKVLSDGYIHPNNASTMWHKKDNRFWHSGSDKMWGASFQSYVATGTFIAPASGQFWLTVDIEGPAIVYYRTSLADIFWDAAKDTVAFWGNEDSAVWNSTVGSGGGDLWKQWSDKVLVKAGANIQIRIATENSSLEETVIKSLHVYIDVPDRQEHFEDLYVPASGLELPIVTPNYMTTAVRIDAVQGSGVVMYPKILSRTPCRIALLNEDGNQVAGTADITWQGFVNETV